MPGITFNIRRFKPFDLQSGVDDKIHILVQEIVNYAESRFAHILNIISGFDSETQGWMQKLLQKELVCSSFFFQTELLTKEKLFVLSYVGVASAIGQIVDIPIIIRSLAASISMLKEEFLPLEFEPDFLALLDTGGPDRPVITRYVNPWWKASRPPAYLHIAPCLDSVSLQNCLDTHRKQLALNIPEKEKRNKLDMRRPFPATTYAGTLAHSKVVIPVAPSNLGPGVSSNVGPGSSSQVVGPVVGSNLSPGLSSDVSSCQKCEQYKDILSNTVNDLVDIHHFTNAMFTSSKAQWKVDMRRASTFNLLYEAAVIKETENLGLQKPSQMTPASVREKAARDLQTLTTALPASSYKWTWGATLTEEDVLSLYRSGTRPKNKIHSGYDFSLIDRRKLKDSTIQSIPTSKGRYDNVPVEVSRPIPDSTERPYLANGDQTVYDPLSILPDSDSPRLPAFAHSWVPESDEDTNQQKAPAPHHHNIADHGNGIADVWEPASDHEVEGALLANIVADSWECASDKEPAPVQIPPATIIADSWECASDEEPAPVQVTPATIIADSWECASDEDQSAPVESPRANIVADSWECASDEETAPVQAPPAHFVGDSWECDIDDEQPGPEALPANIVADSWECASE